jgi:hypothetical protein
LLAVYPWHKKAVLSRRFFFVTEGADSYNKTTLLGVPGKAGDFGYRMPKRS